MAPDDPLNANLERIVTGLRSQLDGSLRKAAEEIVRALAADRDRAVATAAADLRRQAQEQLAQLREAARKQNDDVRAQAEAQVGELRRMLDDLRKNAQQQIDTARRTLDSEVAAARAAAAEADEARRAAQARVEDTQRTADERVAGMERELAQARADLDRTNARIDVGEVAEAIRALDEAASLHQVLERLFGFARRGATRCGITLGEGGQAEPVLGDPTGDGATAIPLTVAGTTVATLYVEVSPSAGGSWPATLDVVARHASRVLETTTVQQAIGLTGPRPGSLP